ncbi:hypothetical protein MMC26_000782 [Xylographa opegraphella]|nr:hypothetical protein [Xylographa opegraphella]
MEIPNPRRILILSPPSTDLEPLIQALTAPPPSSTTPPTPSPSPPLLLLHHIHTPYYRTTIPIWTDHIPSPPAFHTEWLALPGAADVVAAIGAWIIAFPKPATSAELQATQSLLATVAAVISHHLAAPSSSSSFAIVEAPARFAVALPRRQLPLLQLEDAAWEDLCRESGGWEFVDGDGGGGGARNEFGETTGLPRLLEGLQSVEWDADDEGGMSEEGEEEEAMREPIMAADAEGGAERDTGGGGESLDTEGEGLDAEGEEGDAEVQALQRMMLKMQAVKEMGADLPEGERRKLAARAVRAVMRGL